MKKSRLFAFLCALILLMGMMSYASAEKAPGLRMTTVENFMGWNNYRILKNNEKVTFVLQPFAWELYEKVGSGLYTPYNDIIFDCEGKVTAQTNAKWIRIEETTPGFILHFDENPTVKIRTAKVTVSGKNYKATITFQQNGRDQIVSVNRKKNKVTVKVKTGKATGHRITVEAHKNSEDGTYMSKTLISEEITKSAYTFKVDEGWNYSIGVGPTITYDYGWTMAWTGSCYFTVERITGSEKYTFTNKINKLILK